MRRVTTERLTVKPLAIRHSPALFGILSDEKTSWWADIYKMDDQFEADWMIIDFNVNITDVDQFGVFLKGTDTLLGILQVQHPGCTGKAGCYELGYVLSKDHRGKGYMTEAVRAVCDRLFREHPQAELRLEILPDNGGSLGVARRCGFVYEDEPAELKEKRFLDALPLDRYVLRHPETVSAGMAA